MKTKHTHHVTGKLVCTSWRIVHAEGYFIGEDVFMRDRAEAELASFKPQLRKKCRIVRHEVYEIDPDPPTTT